LGYTTINLCTITDAEVDVNQNQSKRIIYK